MPTSCIFSTDLHSMGQFLQDGARIMFETYVDVKHTRNDFYIEELEGNFDGLNFLANQNMSVVNPFNQPGVESYKKNMFALLGKPGYEDRKAELEAALKE